MGNVRRLCGSRNTFRVNLELGYGSQYLDYLFKGVRKVAGCLDLAIWHD